MMMRAISEVMSGQERTPSLHRDWARESAFQRTVAACRCSGSR